MKKVHVNEAVGMVLGHDLTKIVPGEYKGPAFKKGHIIQAEDIPYLKDIGKEHIFLIELSEGQLHENDAAGRIAHCVAGANTHFADPAEGRINILAQQDGLLRINREAVTRINSVEHAVLATLHGNRLVKAGDILAGVKVVPLVVDESMVHTIEEIAGRYSDIIAVQPLPNLKVGIVVTGNEVYYGRIKDKYGPVLSHKLAMYGAALTGITYCPDDREMITQAILSHVNSGADIVVTSGGMSVDPDDVTPEAIRATGADVVTYGAPVLPGAMFMLAYLNDTAILGMPACGMYAKITVFDLVFPRIITGERLSKHDFALMGYGGLCMNCAECSYPACPFGK